uniref:Uncharacterized protein n=1 Tax=viral metagenome TaxID=1070528 RepID=A0A6C0HAR4_9ZZZZ
MICLISDKIFNINNENEYNSKLLDELLVLCKNNSNNDIIILFILDVPREYEIYEYLLETDIYLYTQWQLFYNYLKEYKIIVTSKEKSITLLQFAKKIYYYCKKTNIYYSTEIKGKKTLYLNEYDNVDENDIHYFDNIICDNNFQSNENVVFKKCNFGKIIQFKKTKIQLRKENHITNQNVIFINSSDIDLKKIDKIIYAVSELQKYNILLIIYMPNYINFNVNVKKSDLTINHNDELIYKYINREVKLDKSVLENNEEELQININLPNDAIINYDAIVNLLKEQKLNYSFINHYIPLNEIVQYIYMSDIYIPITNDFNYISLISQKCETYTIFTNDSYNSQEYCVYGDIPMLVSKDYYFNISNQRIEKILRVDDIRQSIETYLNNKNNPEFIYKKEFCHFLF